MQLGIAEDIADGVWEKISGVQTEYEAQIAELQQRLEGEKLEYAVRGELGRAGAVYPDAVRALMRIDAITPDSDVSAVICAEVERIKKECPVLFQGEQPPTVISPTYGDRGDKTDKIRLAMGI